MTTDNSRADALTDLLPCPFCGSTASLNSDHIDFFVLCDSCSGEGPRLQSPTGNHEASKRGATAAWNRRAATPALQPAAAPIDGQICQHCDCIRPLHDLDCPVAVEGMKPAPSPADERAALSDARIDALWCQRFNGVDDRTVHNAEIRNFARMVESEARAASANEQAAFEAWWEREESNSIGADAEQYAWLGWQARAASVSETVDERSALSEQDIYDKFSFLEGLVNESTYVQIADTAIEIARAASANETGAEGANDVTLDRRDLFDFARGAIKSALEDYKAGEGMAPCWYWQEATNRAEALLEALDTKSPYIGSPAMAAEAAGIVHRPAPNGDDFSVEWLSTPRAGNLYAAPQPPAQADARVDQDKMRALADRLRDEYARWMAGQEVLVSARFMVDGADAIDLLLAEVEALVHDNGELVKAANSEATLDEQLRAELEASDQKRKEAILDAEKAREERNRAHVKLNAEWIEKTNALRAELEAAAADKRDALSFRDLMAAVVREIDHGEYDRPYRGIENAPGHAHAVPGIWDSDNGAKAGTQCAWCVTWNAAREALAQRQGEGS